MKRKLGMYAFLPAIGLSLIGTGVASAHGMFGGPFGGTPEEIATRQTVMFEQEAKLLGITVAEIKQAWAEGKNPQQIAQEKGIKQEDIAARLKEAAIQKTKDQLKTLVEKGVITQAQADQRLKTLQTKVEHGKGLKGKGFKRALRF